MTAGWWRPVVMLPVSPLTGLGRTELEAVLAHELAHIARHDYFVDGLQMGMEVLYFHHPAAWWISAVLAGRRGGLEERLMQTHWEERSGRHFRASRRS